MLKLRIITALIAAPIALLAAWKGSWIFTALIAVLALFGWREFYRLLPFSKKPDLLKYLGGFLSLAVVIGAQCNLFFLPVESIWIFGFLLLMSTIFILRDPKMMPLILTSFAGVTYVGIGFAQFIKVRNWGVVGIPEGGLIILAMVVIGTWMNDSCAYFAGTLFGKRKLCPELSPAKSWEGAIAGITATVGTVLLIGTYFKLPYSIAALAFLGILVGIFGIIGDLVESGLKRWAGIKDSGQFFPGHGGILDRTDSLLFVVPATYVWLWISVLLQMIG